MKLKTTVNFDFGKLADSMPKLIEGIMTDMKTDSVKETKDFIKSGKVTPDIETVTKTRRIRRGNPPQPPLYETHKLHDSIRVVKTGMEMLKYGGRHQFGDGRPIRKFVQAVASKETYTKFTNAIRKAMHLSTPIKSS